MRYLSINKDGSIATWATVPLKIVENISNDEFIILGVRRKFNSCYLYGYWKSSNEGAEIMVGDENFDVSDMSPDHIQGYTIIFPDFEKDILAKLPKESRSNHSHHKVIKKSDLAKDEHRVYRGAFIEDNGKVGIDMTKAKEIHKNIIRAHRKPLLDSLDTEYLRADERHDKDTKDSIAIKKQQLRDITDHIAITNASTPDELLTLTLDVLLKSNG